MIVGKEQRNHVALRTCKMISRVAYLLRYCVVRNAYIPNTSPTQCSVRIGCKIGDSDFIFSSRELNIEWQREDYREYSGSIPGRNQSSERASCLRRKRDYVAPHQAAIQHSGKRRATSLPTGNRAPSGAVIFSRISVFVSKKHSRSILRDLGKQEQ